MLLKFCQVLNIGETSTIKLQIFKRTTGGVETDLFEMESETIENTADYALFRFESSQLGFATNTTDRLAVGLNPNNNRTSNTTITYIIGNGRGLYFNTTLPTRHDTLRALNEDDNFLHVTSTEKSVAITKPVQQYCVEWGTELAVEDGVRIEIPPECNGMNLISARARVGTARNN